MIYRYVSAINSKFISSIWGNWYHCILQSMANISRGHFLCYRNVPIYYRKDMDLATKSTSIRPTNTVGILYPNYQSISGMNEATSMYSDLFEEKIGCVLNFIVPPKWRKGATPVYYRDWNVSYAHWKSLFWNGFIDNGRNSKWEGWHQWLGFVFGTFKY